MPREIRTAAQIRAMIQEKFNAVQEVKEDGANVTIHEVQWHAPDETGCNWYVFSFRGDRHYAGLVAAIIEEVRSKYNLPNQ